jgi:polysaccharide export outer membrane protein
MGIRILPASLLCLALAAVIVAAAQAPKPAEAPQPQSRDARLTDAELDKTTSAPVDLKSYLIGPEDVLLVRVWREPDLSGVVVVRPDGEITLPLVKEVKAEGLTPAQLGATIASALTKFINKPDVLVSVQSVRSKKYLLSGEIGRPGTYPLVLPTTVIEAIVGAGGFREYANKKNIIIMRGTQRLKFNYNDVIKGKRTEQNILIEHNDHIIVP